MNSHESLLRLLYYGRESLQVEAFHKLTNNRYKTGLKLLCPLRELDDNNKFHDYSGNGFHGTPTDVSLTGHGKGKHVFANALPETDTQFVTFTGINFGTNDFSIAVCASHYNPSDYNNGDAHIIHGYLGGAQQVGIVYRSDNKVRININGALGTTTAVSVEDPHMISASVDRDDISTLYVDDVSITDGISGTSATVLDLGTYRLFKRDIGGISYLTGGASWMFMWENRLITQDEHYELESLLKPRRFDSI